MATCHTGSWWSFAAPWSVHLATMQATLSAAFTLSGPHLCGVPVGVLQLLRLGGPLLGDAVKGADGPTPLPQPRVHVLSLGVLVSRHLTACHDNCAIPAAVGATKCNSQHHSIISCINSTCVGCLSVAFQLCGVATTAHPCSRQLPFVGCKPAVPQGNRLQTAPLLNHSTVTNISSAPARHSLEEALSRAEGVLVHGGGDVGASAGVKQRCHTVLHACKWYSKQRGSR